MATVLLIGTDIPLLEGLTQSLAALGHEAVVALSFPEAVEIAAAKVPLIAIADRAMAIASSEVYRLPVGAGGALVLYHLTGDTPPQMPPALQRLILADLTLPLERQRMVALVQHVQDRARAAGRERPRTPPDAQEAPH
jgi:hypothetical protein